MFSFVAPRHLQCNHKSSKILSNCMQHPAVGSISKVASPHCIYAMKSSPLPYKRQKDASPSLTEVMFSITCNIAFFARLNTVLARTIRFYFHISKQKSLLPQITKFLFYSCSTDEIALIGINSYIFLCITTEWVHNLIRICSRNPWTNITTLILQRQPRKQTRHQQMKQKKINKYFNNK